MCCASRFCTAGRGAAGSRSKQMSKGPGSKNASPGEQSEAPRRRWKPGQEQHPGPENQDSQHMLNQPRGSFSDFHTRATDGKVDASSLVPDTAKLRIWTLRFWVFRAQELPSVVVFCYHLTPKALPHTKILRSY